MHNIFKQIGETLRRQPAKLKKTHDGHLEPRAITHASILLRGMNVVPDLPFTPFDDEVIFVEDGYDDVANAFILEHYDRIVDRFAHSGYRFTYLPRVSRDLLESDDTWSYLKPYGTVERPTEVPVLTSDYLLNYLLRPANRPLVAAPAFVRHNTYLDPDENCHVFTRVEFVVDDVDDFDSYFDDVVTCVSRDALVVRYSAVPSQGRELDNIEDYDAETQALLTSARLLIDRLMHRGVSEAALSSLLIPQPKLSRLVITPDNRILLPDYNDMEVTMTPLVKAVYFLFLRHPEGLAFKQLANHREELARLYDNIKSGYPATRRLLGTRHYDDSILALTDPLNNSINEKCARIKEAFLTRFHVSMAQHYYVTGTRGNLRRIDLPPRLLEWQSSEA